MPRRELSPTPAPGPSAAPAGGRDAAAGAPSAAFAPDAVVQGRFRLTAHLGRGAMGSVFAAEDLLLGSRVALKFLPAELASDADARRRLYREVALTRAVRSLHVAQVYDVGESEGRPFLSMELVDGESLDTLLARRAPLEIADALTLAVQIAAGLGAAHDAGVLHRDLKPANVLVTRSGAVRLTDFGLASTARGGCDEPNAGTPATMAPEQLVGRGASVRSDLFSLGLVLYELFTGRPAVRADTIEDLMRAHEHFPPPAPSVLRPDLPTEASRAVLACLAVDADRRPRSAAEVGRALDSGVRSLKRARRRLVTTLPALLLGAAAALGLATGRSEPTSRSEGWTAAAPSGTRAVARLPWADERDGRRDAADRT